MKGLIAPGPLDSVLGLEARGEAWVFEPVGTVLRVAGLFAITKISS
jgi:hypothetical protein